MCSVFDNKVYLKYIYIILMINKYLRICSAFYNDSLKQIVNLTIIEIFVLYLTVDLFF